MTTTVWDKIYRNYVKGEVYWVLKSDSIMPDFKSYVEKSTFSVKEALDIGCGRGQYLKYLEELGFSVSGIDSSPTAIDLSKAILSAKANVAVADMFRYEIPKDKFDLIVSISAIHHGGREEVNNVINRVISAIRPNGKIFIIIPVYPDERLIHRQYKKMNSRIKRLISGRVPNRGTIETRWEHVDGADGGNEDDYIYLKDGATLSISGPEKGIIHAFYKREELDKLFSNCREHTIERKAAEWIIKATRAAD